MSGDWQQLVVVPGLRGGFIARRSGSYPIPNAKRLGVHRPERWEVEGYGDTPEAAKADLARKMEPQP